MGNLTGLKKGDGYIANGGAAPHGAPNRGATRVQRTALLAKCCLQSLRRPLEQAAKLWHTWLRRRDGVPTAIFGLISIVTRDALGLRLVAIRSVCMPLEGC